MDILYYAYCISMGRDEKEFFSSSIAKIAKMIDIHADKLSMEKAAAEGSYYESKYFGGRVNEPEVVYSMRDVV